MYGFKFFITKITQFVINKSIFKIILYFYLLIFWLKASVGSKIYINIVQFIFLTIKNYRKNALVRESQINDKQSKIYCNTSRKYAFNLILYAPYYSFCINKNE